MKEIESLLPHRAPFLYVDEVEAATNEQIVGTKVFSADDGFLTASFPEFGFVPGMVLIESLAQCGGAGVKKLGFTAGLFALASLESVQFFKGIEFGKTFRMIIKNVRLSERLIKQSGIGYAGDDKVVEANWTCVRIQ